MTDEHPCVYQTKHHMRAHLGVSPIHLTAHCFVVISILRSLAAV
jgi:hypothetical protein